MEKQPRFIQEYSKDTNSDGRDRLAEEIRNVRRKKKEHKDHENELEGLKSDLESLRNLLK